MNEKTYFGKKTGYFIANLILSFISLATCITALAVTYYGELNAYSIFLILDMIIIVLSTISTFFPSKVATFGYIGGAICAFIAFCTTAGYGLISVSAILPTVYQGVCAVYCAFMKVTVTLEDEFLSAKGVKSTTLIPYEKIDYLTTGIFSSIDFRSAPGRISCVFVGNANSLFREVSNKRKEALIGKTIASVNHVGNSIIDELPEL